MLISCGILHLKYIYPKSEFWFLKPVKRHEGVKDKICHHRGSCLSYTCEGIKKFFSLGFLIELARSAIWSIPLIKKGNWTMLGYLKNIKFGLTVFLVSYIGIYRTVHCFLNNLKGKDSNICNSIAAFVSGTSFYVWPNIKVLTLAFSIFLQTAWNYMVDLSKSGEKGSILQKINKLPLDVLIWTIFLSMVFNYRVFTPYYVSKYGQYAMDSISGEV